MMLHKDWFLDVDFRLSSLASRRVLYTQEKAFALALA